MVRAVLIKWHPGSFKAVYLLPSLFLVGFLIFLALGALFSKIFLLPFALFALLIFIESLLVTKSLLIAAISIYASYIQLLGYGFGFIKGAWKILILKQDERKSLSNFFFKDPKIAT